MLMMPFDVLWKGCCWAFAPLGSGPLITTIAAPAAAAPIERRALPPCCLDLDSVAEPTAETLTRAYGSTKMRSSSVI